MRLGPPRHSLVIVFNLDVSVHVPLVLDLRTIQNLIQPSQVEEMDVVGPVRGADLHSPFGERGR